MEFFNSAIDVLQTLVIALGAGLGIWGVINLLEGYGNDNPGAKSQGIKQLMTEDEIAVMDGGKCILQLRGVRPFFSDKYDITKHPNYKYLSDYDKKNTFDMEKHLRRRPALVKPDEPFDYYEISEADLQEDTDHE